MNFIKKIFLFVKNIFNRKEIKVLEAPKQKINSNHKPVFSESLKINMTDKKEKKEIDMLICEGDGLGIQKKISY